MSMFECFNCRECGIALVAPEVDGDGYYTCLRCRNVGGCPSQCDNGTLYRGNLRWACPNCDAGSDIWLPAPESVSWTELA